MHYLAISEGIRVGGRGVKSESHRELGENNCYTGALLKKHLPFLAFVSHKKPSAFDIAPKKIRSILLLSPRESLNEERGLFLGCKHSFSWIQCIILCIWLLDSAKKRGAGIKYRGGILNNEIRPGIFWTFLK